MINLLLLFTVILYQYAYNLIMYFNCEIGKLDTYMNI